MELCIGYSQLAVSQLSIAYSGRNRPLIPEQTALETGFPEPIIVRLLFSLFPMYRSFCNFPLGGNFSGYRVFG